MPGHEWKRGAAAIVGVADVVLPHRRARGHGPGLEAEVIAEALDDAGLTIADVDGVASCTGGLVCRRVELAEYLGIQPRWTDSTQTGGSSFEIHVEHAAAAIALGLCEVAVVVYAGTPRSTCQAGRRASRGRRPADAAARRGSVAPRLEWETALRHAHADGRLRPGRQPAHGPVRHDAEQLAQIAVAPGEWAAINPRARSATRSPSTTSSPRRCRRRPLHKLDCCLVTDGAGAVVSTSAERARDLRKPPGLRARRRPPHPTDDQPDARPDRHRRGRSRARGPSSRPASRPADVDVARALRLVHHHGAAGLEDLGFCPKGEGGAFVADGALGPGGRLPPTPPAAACPTPIPACSACSCWWRRSASCAAARRPPGAGAEVALAHGIGGVLSATSTVILGREDA